MGEVVEMRPFSASTSSLLTMCIRFLRRAAGPER